MTNDEDRFENPWERLAEMTLPVYRLAGWDGVSSVAETGALGRTAVTTEELKKLRGRVARRVAAREPDEQIVTSKTIAHRRKPDNGEFVNVASSLPDAVRDHYRQYPVSNMLIAAIKDERETEWPEDPKEQVRQAAKERERRQALQDGIDTGRIAWRPITILVDGTGVEFEVVSVGFCSAAVAFLDEVDIALWSRRVELADLKLIRDA